MSFPSTFPPEIEDYIIDQVGYSPRTLRQCALTCSRWLPRSRYNIFVDVQVATREQLFSLCSAIAEYPHLRPLVRSVTLEVIRRPESAHLIETIPVPLLTLLPHLTRWSLLGRVYVERKKTVEDTENTEGQGAGVNADIDAGQVCHTAYPCHRMALASLRRHSTTIQELNLHNACFQTCMDCPRLLLSFPALRSFSCSSLVVKTYQVIPDTWMNRVADRIHIRYLSVSA